MASTIDGGEQWATVCDLECEFCDVADCLAFDLSECEPDVPCGDFEGFDPTEGCFDGAALPVFEARGFFGCWEGCPYEAR